MWIRRGKHGTRSLTPIGNALVVEAEGFLSGGLVDVLTSHDEKIPGWAWLNELAHGELAAVVRLSSSSAIVGPSADNDVDSSWRVARQLLADNILELVGRDIAHMHRLQREVLVPLELRLMSSKAEQPLTPALLVSSTRAALRSSISE